MHAAEIISHLQRRGITLKVVAGSLKVRGAEKLSAREKTALQAHRSAILKALAAGPDNPIATVNQAPPAGATAVTGSFSREAVNREAMPQVAVAVDAIRAVFGPVRVVFAEEAGHRLGTAPATSKEGRS